MATRSMLALLALLTVAGCHRRVFEKEENRGEVIVASTTVITNADVPLTEPATPTPTPTPTQAQTPTPTTLSEPLPPAPSEADRTAANLGLRDAGESTTATPPPLPASEEPRTEEPPRRRASAADRIPWAGDSNRR